jgi:hypothetical protein
VYERLEEDPQQSEIVLRRMERFFGIGGLCDRYERRGDHLVQFHDIADLVTDTVPTVSREIVVRRFLFSAKVDWFGRHGPRRTIEQLIDLDCSFAPRGRYSLRPSYIRVEASPELVRAPRSVWARWLKAQGWPVPPELETVARGRAGNRPPAGYDPVWISFDEGVRRVMRAAACDQCEAIKGVVAACRDGKVASRYGNTHEPIESVSWVRASIVTGYRVEVHGYVLVAIVPRANEIFAAPREMLGPTSPDDGVPRVDRAWSYPPIELCREDIERLWPSEGVMALSMDRPPDWGFWRHVPNVTLPEGVALSLNIDPRRLRPNRYSWRAGQARFDEGPEFENRLLLAQRCLGDTLPALNAVASGYLGYDPLVILRHFSAWASSVGWQIPHELASLKGESVERPSGAPNPDPDEQLTLPEQVLSAPYSTGLPGRPSSWSLIEAEFQRRYASGERHAGKVGESSTEWARILTAWLCAAHPKAVVSTEKTVRNKLSGLLRELATAAPKA